MLQVRTRALVNLFFLGLFVITKRRRLLGAAQSLGLTTDDRG